MKYWKKVQLYRQQFENNTIDEKAFIELLKAALQEFSNENLFAKERDLLIKFDILNTYFMELEQQNIALQAMNSKLEQLIVNKLNAVL